MAIPDDRLYQPAPAADGLRFTVATDRLPNGVVAEYPLLAHPGACAIVPFPSADTVIMIRQYRPVLRQFVWEVPAGKLAAGESAADCAARELREEVGRVAGLVRHLATLWMEPGYTDEVMHLFRADDLGRVPHMREDDEIIEQREVGLDEAFALIRAQPCWDAKSLIALELAVRGSEQVA